MNSISRRILSAIAFFAILLALLIALSALLRPKGFRREDGVQDPIANAVYLEPEQTIDVLFLGDSETYCSFIPLQIYKEHGITSFVCGTSLQMLSYTEEFLHGVFEKQSPKIVFLETNTVFRNEDIFSEIARSAERIFPVFRYHNRWKTVFSTKESRVRNAFLDGAKGYIYDTSLNPAKTDRYLVESNEKEPLPLRNFHHVRAMRDFCAEHGARLILISTPSTVNWSMKIHNATQALADELNLCYIDCNLNRTEIPIDWESDTRDKGDHLNHSGAQKVTKFVGNYLQELTLFEDHRNDPSYSAWDDAVSEFEAAIGKELP